MVERRETHLPNSFPRTIWEPVSLVRNSTTVFDGKTMFSFMFDFSELGDPSQLSQQADLNCWAEGADDSGWDLVSSTGNSELDPWLEAPLNNIGPDLALENVELTGEARGRREHPSVLLRGERWRTTAHAFQRHH